MNRDWQEDKELAHEARNEYKRSYLNPVLDALFYWLEESKRLCEVSQQKQREILNLQIQYAAEKERAGRLQEELAKINCDYYADKQRFVVQRRELEDTKRREQKLKEALEHCIKEFPQWDSKEIAGTLMVDYMNNILSILYPKEETKP